jgi:hypothetical protein
MKIVTIACITNMSIVSVYGGLDTYVNKYIKTGLSFSLKKH